MVWAAVAAVILSACLASGSFNLTWPLPRATEVTGDVVLGALMMVHEREDRLTCGPIMPQGGIQALECLLYTVDWINTHSDFLPGFTLGVYVLDDCDKDTYGLEQAVEFIKGSLSNIGGGRGGTCSQDSGPQRQVSGVLGAASSATSIQVANLLRLFQIPQVSYFSTSPELSNKQRFEYFLRTVPSDTNQVRAMVDIVRLLHWNYVSILYEESNYGLKAFEVLENLLEANDICIAVKERLLKDSGVAGEEIYDQIVLRLLSQPRARGVIIFGSDQEVAGVMRAVRRNNATGTFAWIGSDGWSARRLVWAGGHEPEVSGTLSLQPKASRVPGFEDYFRKLHPNTNLRNPWFAEYWEHVFNCRWSGQPPTPYNSDRRTDCTGKEIYTELQIEKQLQFVSDAVLAFAVALKDLHADVCKGRSGLCERMRPVSGPTLLAYLKKVTFVGLTGDKFSFNEQGDGPVRYDIIHFRKIEETGGYEWIRVGHYVAGKLTLHLDKISFRSGEPEPPASVCSDPCPPGHARQPAAEGDRCCWRCTACNPYEVLRDGIRCEECLPGFLPSPIRRDACVPVPERYLKPSSPWALAAMGVAIIGACATLFAGVTFARHADTPVVRAAGRELSYALLGGVLACYGVTFLLVQRPTDMICGAQNAAIGHAFSLVYGALWTKTNRIARIFREGKRSARRPGFISPRSQLAICGGLVGIQASLTAVLLAYIPARVLRKHPTRDLTLLMCSEGLHALAFAYPSFLVAVCTVYAVLTRRVPGAFNESKHIGFSMYTTCVIWLAFVPIYVTTAQHAELRTAATALAVSLSASVILACLFAPKLYVILLRPERNVRPVLSAKAAQMNSLKMETSAQSEGYVVVYDRGSSHASAKQCHVSTQTTGVALNGAPPT